MLLDLAQFQNVQQNAQMGITGQHAIGNLNTGAKSQTQFLDTPDGRFTVVKNTNNAGQMQIQGKHMFDNFTNNGQTTVMARKFKGLENLDEEQNEEELENLEEQQPEEAEVENLATFNNV